MSELNPGAELRASFFLVLADLYISVPPPLQLPCSVDMLVLGHYLCTKQQIEPCTMLRPSARPSSL